MIDCTHALNALADYVGNELDAEQRRLIDVHVVSCAACRAEFEAVVGVARCVEDALGVPELTHNARSGARPAGGDAATANSAPAAVRAGSRMTAMWRYAAILALGIGIGWVVGRGSAEGLAPRPIVVDGTGGAPEVPAPSDPPLRTIHPAWMDAARQRDLASGTGASSGLAVLALVRRGGA